MKKKYWSIQNELAWEEAKNTGYLVGSEKYIMDVEFADSYQWMMQQMMNKLKRYEQEWPIWLWLKKPDMRHSAHAMSGKKIVRLTIELEETEVLVSDFDKWHCVLNNSFCSLAREEDEEWENGTNAMTKAESWERIFDIVGNHDPELWGDPKDIRLQGVTGKIGLDQVKKVEFFVAR